MDMDLDMEIRIWMWTPKCVVAVAVVVNHIFCIRIHSRARKLISIAMSQFGHEFISLTLNQLIHICRFIYSILFHWSAHKMQIILMCY